jgi:hypothetical protein
MRWIFHLDLANRDSNSFFSPVNKIRQDEERFEFFVKFVSAMRVEDDIAVDDEMIWSKKFNRW